MNTESPKKPAQFVKATDSRGREIQGLWVRNSRYYYQLYVPSKRRAQMVPLFDEENLPVTSLMAAQDAAAKLRQDRREGENPQSRRAPFFPEFVKTYITWLEETDAKSRLTINKEEGHLKGWAKFLGEVRVNDIAPSDVTEYVLQRKQEGVSNRTANLDVIALSNCLKRAQKDGWVKGKLPTENFEMLKHTPPKRPLFTREEIDALCSEALRMTDDAEPKRVHVTGEQLADWLRLMQWSGARHTAALSCKWADVDFDNKQLTLHTKYSKTVVVDFNENLEAHLEAMKARRVENEPFLFPAIRCDGQNGHLTRMYKSLLNVKTEVAKKFPRVADFTPHDLRHFFISWCVASGIDFLVIKDWVGHADTKLISNTYGHIANEHRASAVKKLSTKTPLIVLETHPKQGAALDLSKVSAEELLAALQQKVSEKKAA